MSEHTGGAQSARQAAAWAGSEQSARWHAYSWRPGGRECAGWAVADRLTRGAVALSFPALRLVQQVGEAALAGPRHGLATCKADQRHGLLLTYYLDRSRKTCVLCGAQRSGMWGLTV